MKALHRHQIHVVERQFAQFGDLRLDEERRTRRVETRREVIERHLHDVLPHLFGIVRIVRERLCVGDHDEYALEFARVLQFDAAAQRSDVMPQMEPARGAVAGKNDFSHSVFQRSCFVYVWRSVCGPVLLSGSGRSRRSGRPVVVVSLLLRLSDGPGRGFAAASRWIHRTNIRKSARAA